MTSLNEFYSPAVNLRNGAVANVTAVHLTGGIAPAYHYIAMDNTHTVRAAAAADVAPAQDGHPAIALGDRIRVVPSNQERIVRAAALYSVRLTTIAPAMNADKRRRAARILAGGRYAQDVRLALNPNNHYAAQTAPVVGWWTAGAEGGFTWVAAAGNDPALTADAVNAEYVAAAADESRTDVMVGLAAVGLAVTTGVIVHATKGHHYVDPHKATSKAVLNQVFGAGYEALLPLEPSEVEDLMCHKLSHTIDSGILVNMALDAAMAERLTALNLASAAVRVPARIDIEKRWSSFVAVLDQVAPMLPDMNLNVGTLRADLVAEAERVRREYLAAETSSAKMAAETASRARIAEYESHVCTLYGAYLAMTEMEDEATATLKKAKGLSRLARDNTAPVARGREMYQSARAWKTDRVRAGTLLGAAIYNGVAPPEKRPDVSESPMAALGPLFAAMGRGGAPS